MKKFKNLKGREVKPNTPKVEKLILTKEEIDLIQNHINNYNKGDSYIKSISKRIHIDFIGWDKPEYNDLLICLNK